MLRQAFIWCFGAVPVTLVCLIGYVLIQQDYREGLNDPQIQLAEDAAVRLGEGAVPAEIVPHGTPLIDIENSLAPWLAVYDQQGLTLESSGQFEGAPPHPPSGVFDAAQWLAHPSGLFYNQSPVRQNRFTWQPKSGVRQAVVLTQTADKKYFVAAGRNMREVEQRIEHEGEIVFIGWLAALFALLVVQLAYVVIVGGTARGDTRRG